MAVTNNMHNNINTETIIRVNPHKCDALFMYTISRFLEAALFATPTNMGIL